MARVAWWCQPSQRALRPGGLLLMQELFLPSDEPSVRALLDGLFFRLQDVAFGRSAESLAVEAATEGFERADIIDSPLGRLVLVHKPGHGLSPPE
ncbi:hypothetical protein ACQP1G_12840 [Nocardia sp. CA-107356]|uniref:hypothetical protein n=1 Tax=Nocardia sp. CA-107356 TaxID=3239972 RepID=UPI003D8B4ABF